MSSAGMSLASLLPAPSTNAWDRDEERVKFREQKEEDSKALVSVSNVPPYGKRTRGFVPRLVSAVNTYCNWQ